MVAQEEGGKAVAILGSWGSGKSTIVELLKVELSKGGGESQAEVFVFDAWSHDRDPLRRTFLEQLIDFLNQKGWIDKEWSEHTKKVLARREKKSIQKRTPQLTPMGLVAAVATLLVPLGTALLGFYPTKSTVGNIILGSLGTIMTAAPFLLLVCWVLRGWRRHRDWKKLAGRMLPLLVTSVSDTTITQTLEDPEPTSVEFQSIFSQVLRCAFQDYRNRRLVVVIDNLDRVETEHALRVWSVMRAFFEPIKLEDRSWMRQLWLIVPMDPKAVGEIWREEEKAESFLDKTFQTRFYVPTPVLSDWRAYFEEQLTTAFPWLKRNEVQALFALFRIKGVPETGLVTPRDIKMFVNRLVAIYRQWGHEIPLRVQALFVLCYKEIQKNPQEALLQANFVDSKVQRILAEPDWQKYLAALWFNVEPGKAAQVLMGSPIGRALSNGDGVELSRFKDFPGFQDVLSNVLHNTVDEWLRSDPATIAKAAVALYVATVEDSSVWELLRRSLFEIKDWSNIEYNHLLGSGLSLILNRCEGEELEKTAEAVVSGICGIKKLDNPVGWYETAREVLDTLYRKGMGKFIRENFAVPGTVEQYLAVVTRMGTEIEDVAELAPFFAPTVEQSQVIRELSARCAAAQLQPQHIAVVRVMTLVHQTWNWRELISAIQARVRVPNAQPSETLACIGILMELAYGANLQDAVTVLNQLVSSGIITNHLHMFHSRNQVDGVAYCALALLEFLPALGVQSAGGSPGLNTFRLMLSNPKEFSDVVAEMTRLVVRFKRLSHLVRSCQKETKVLVGSLCEEAWARYHGGSEFTAEFVLAHFVALKQIISPETLRALVQSLMEQGELIELMLQRPFDGSLGSLYFMVVTAQQKSLPKHVARYLINGLRNLGHDDWLSDLQGQGELVNLGLALQEMGFSLQLGLSFRDAVLTHVRNSIKKGEDLDRKDWDAIVKMVVRKYQRTLAADLRDDLLDLEEGFRTLLTAFGARLIKDGRLEAKADELFRGPFRKILSRADVTELEWLNSALELCPQLLTKAPEESIAQLYEHLQKQLSNDQLEPEAIQVMRDIAVKLYETGIVGLKEGENTHDEGIVES
ncbi:MAG: KAP family NTPase [Firmicutes bacterium]|nr:KAP family NTPase [Bacillota bacterium]